MLNYQQCEYEIVESSCSSYYKFSKPSKMATETKKVKSSKGKTFAGEEIYNGFQILRSEQRNLAGKLSEMELELNEHK